MTCLCNHEYYIDSGRDIAVKELNRSSETPGTESSQSFLSFQKEVAVMALLKHPNLIRLLGVMLQPLRMVLGTYNYA